MAQRGTCSCTAYFFVQLIVLLHLRIPHVVNAVVWKVGDDLGTWAIPDSANGINYTDWAQSRNFTFNDELLFRYSNDSHSVLRVNASSYASCLLIDPIEQFHSGLDTIPLNISGVTDYYFICGEPTNCFLLQKLHVSLEGFVPGQAAQDGPDTPPPPRAKSYAPNGVRNAEVIIPTLVVAFITVIVLK